MRRYYRFAHFSIVILAAVLCSQRSYAQVESAAQSRRLITQSIDERNLVRLRGNTRPEVNAANDRGRAFDFLPIEHIQLLLHLPAEKEQALDRLTRDLQDPSSPNYHKWLTPDQFRQQFSLAPEDIDTITSWLQSQGFTINVIYPRSIDFSGTAGQVRNAFRSEIHNLDVNGVTHFANTSDPMIPAALAPVVIGVVSLNDFMPHPLNHPRTDYTTGSGSYLVVPADLATIYNFNPVFTRGISGQGQTIVVIEDTNVFSTADWNTFRATLGLSGYTSGSFTQIHPAPLSGTNNCTDPGVNSDDVEAILDAEWATASAPSASIVLASCANTGNFGGFIALQNLLNASSTPPSIVSISYGESEPDLGAAANSYISALYAQAVAEGVSIFVSSGDEGAASSDANLAYASHGITVSGFASTPYNVSVGGTDFGDAYTGSNNIYWNSVNTSAFESAKSYVPEIPWNDSCGSGLIASYLGFATAYGSAGFCNSSTGIASFLATTAASGGPSGCATGAPATSGVVGGSCAGYAKPTWQSVFGNPGDGVRDIPDVSLFAANGVWGHYYVVCYSDTGAGRGGKPCTGTPNTWSGFGGTSISAPIMAAIQALINQTNGSSAGNPNPTYYSLASAEYGGAGNSTCNSTLGSGASSSCIFYDVTQGDIDVNCRGAANCYLPSGTNGVLSKSNSQYQPAYAASSGWDFATGIGTVNVNNLVNNWPKPPSITSGSSATFIAGTQGTFTVTASGVPAPTLTESGSLPSGILFNAGTGVLGGTPAAGTGGVYSISFTASNGVGANAVQSFTFTVNQAPAFTSSNGATFTVGTQGTFSLAASGFPVPSLTESGALPSGITFNTATGVLAGLPAAGTSGSYSISFTASNGVGTSAVQSFTLTVNSQGGGVTWSNSYTYRRAMTIDHTKIPNADQVNFPVLLSGTYSYLATTGNGGNVTSGSGYDMVFTSDAAGTSALAYERESYNGTTGAVNIWVKVPVVSHTTDTVIYMFYGNGSVTTDQSNRTGVWDSNYLGVYHLPNGTTLSAGDSTGNGNNGTISGATAGTGKVGGGGSFNGTSGYMSIPGVAFGYPTSGTTSSYGVSFSAWFKTTTSSVILGQTDGAQPNGSANGWVPGIYVDSVGKVRASLFWHGAVTDQIVSVGTYNDNSWHFVEDTYGAGSETLYMDGQAVGSQTFSEGAYSSGYSYFIGTGYWTAWPGAGGGWGYLNGSVDEVRASNTARSANWVAAEYNNESNPTTFYSLGAADISGAPPSPPSAPAGLTAGPGNTQISLAWNASSGATSYNIYSSMVNGGPYSKITSVTVTNYTNTGLTNGTTYYYVVTAANVNGESGYSSQASATPSATSWSNSYTYRRAMTIDHTKIPNADQVNFPVLLSGTYSYLATTGNGGNVTSGSGYDMVFTSDAAGTSALAYERESYNGTTGAVNIWVKVPVVSHTTDTVIYMFYGNGSVTTDQSNRTGVWDSNYLGVYHLPNGTTLSAGDSTGNGNNGTISGATAGTGKVGGGGSFNGTSGYMSIPGVAFGYPTSGTTSSYGVSFSAWFKTTTSSVILGQTDGAQPNGSANGWVPGIYVDSVGKVRASLFWHGAVTDQIVSVGTYNDNSWHFVEDTYGAGSETLYMDGQAVGSQTFSEGAYSSGYSYFIGTGYWTAWPGAGGGWGYLNGSVDEVRASNTARSANWVAAEYNNESNPTTFYSLGAADISGAPPSPPSAPAGLTAGPGNTQISLAWNASSGATSYNIYSSMVNGGPYSKITSVTVTNYTNTGLTNGTTYYYVVTAANVNGESGYSSQASATPSATSWSNSYTYRRAMTIDHTKIPNADQVNFPVLLSGTYSYLATTGNGGNVTSGSGYDMVFTSDAAGTSALAYERESYNGTTGAVNIWVKVPVVSHTTDTVIYMFYGNGSVTTDQSNRTGVWDSNYLGVYHLPNGTTLSAGDSTGNGNNGTISGATAGTGKVGGGGSFNGTSGYMSIPGVAFGYPTSGTTSSYGVSFSAWFKTTTSSVILGQTDGAQPNGSANGWVPGIYVDSVGKVRASLFWHGAVTDQIVSVGTYNDNSWHFVEDTYGAGSETLYMDGQAVGSQTFSEGAYSSGYSYFIGTGYWTAWPGAGGGWGYLNGSVDEVRASNTARSANWVAAEYNNESNPTTFYSLGAADISGAP